MTLRRPAIHPIRNTDAPTAAGRRDVLERLSGVVVSGAVASSPLAAGLLAIAPIRSVRAQSNDAAAPNRAPARMVWPTPLTQLDGAPWTPPSASHPSAVVLVFWSTTCPFCARHNPHVQKLHAASAGKALRVVTTAQDARLADITAYQQRNGYQFPVLREHDALRRPFMARRVIPLTVVIDREGLVREVIPGEMFEEDVLGLLKAYT